MITDMDFQLQLLMTSLFHSSIVEERNDFSSITFVGLVL